MLKMTLLALGTVTAASAFTGVPTPADESQYIEVAKKHHGHHRHHGYKHHHPRRHYGAGPAMSYSTWCTLNPYKCPLPYRYTPVPVPVYPYGARIILGSFGESSTPELYHGVSSQNPYTDYIPGGTTNPPMSPSPIRR